MKFRCFNAAVYGVYEWPYEECERNERGRENRTRLAHSQAGKTVNALKFVYIAKL